MITFEDIVTIEYHFDHFNSEIIKSSALSEDYKSLPYKIYFYAEHNDWNKAITACESLWKESKNRYSQVFALQMAVAIAEEQHNMELRESWLQRWSDIIEWESIPWCRFIFLYQKGISFFYLGENLTAKKYFNFALIEAKNSNYSRGVYRCEFHLSLIAGESEGQFKRNFLLNELSRKLENEPNPRLEKKINRILEKHDAFTQIENLILNLRLNEARKQLLEHEKRRRYANKTRLVESFEYLWALYGLFSKKNFVYMTALKSLKDPIMLERLLHFKKKYFTLTELENNQLGFLVLKNDILDIEKNETFNKLESLANQSLNSDVSKLIKLFLLSATPISKQFITEKIWNYSYDPVIHDNKIYKLINKTRNFIGIKDIFLNTYGEYRINPKFIS